MHNNTNISTQLQTLFQSLPESMQQHIKTERFVKKVNEQFSQVLDKELIPYINAVYLLDDKQALAAMPENAIQPSDTPNISISRPKKLVVYVENSICATEINAKRELYILKYRELFGITITLLEIRISKAAYKHKHPLVHTADETSPLPTPLTLEEQQNIDEMVEGIENPVLRESFKKVLIAQKQQKKI